MLEAVFITGVDEVRVSGLTQWDRGQTVQITCPNLPTEFQVHFANRKSKKAIVTKATSSNNVATVVIPDEILREPFEVFAYIYLNNGVIGETVKTLRMPVEARSMPDDYIIELPQEQATDAEKIVLKFMDEYIAKDLEAAMSATQARTDALAAKADAEAARDEAVGAQQAIENMAVDVTTLEAGSEATVTKTVENGAALLHFSVPRGAPGNDIESIQRTSGNGAPGTTDTYTVTLTDETTHNFYVYNGRDGAGAGDMTIQVYDPQGKKQDIFAYVDDKVENMEVPSGSWNDLTDKPSSFPPSSHSHSYDDLTNKPMIVNPNLLDNWYFGNPVNQRGQTEFATNGITIDRWGKTGQLANLTAEGMELVATSGSLWFHQGVEHNLRGKKVTLSVLTADGQLAIASGVVSNDDGVRQPIKYNNSWGGAIYVETASGNHNNVIMSAAAGQTATIIAVKLELGDEQTLAHQENGVWVLNEIPGYGEQLARCQRYYQVFSSEDKRPTDLIDYRPAMRANPAVGTITIDGVTRYFADANL